MGNKSWKDDLEFSPEELSDLEESRENRSQNAPSGRPRRRTNRGLRVPSDVVPRRRRDEAEDGLDLDLSPGPLMDQPEAAWRGAQGSPAPAAINQEPEDAPTEPMLSSHTLPLNEASPGGLIGYDTPPDDQSALITIPVEEIADAQQAQDAFQPLPSSIDPQEAEALDEEQTFVEKLEDEGSVGAGEANAEGIPPGVAREAVRRALELVGTPSHSQPCGEAAMEFDSGGTSDLSAEETIGRLADHQSPAAPSERPENENDRANRVAILLSALKTPAARKGAAGASSPLANPLAARPAEAVEESSATIEDQQAPQLASHPPTPTSAAADADEAEAEADADEAKDPVLAAHPRERTPSAEISLDDTLADEELPDPAAAKPAAAAVEQHAAMVQQPAAGSPAARQETQEAQGAQEEEEEGRGSASELEELSGEELEEVSGEQEVADEDQTFPPPIPAGPSAAVEDEEHVQAFHVPIAEDEDVMTSAPHEPPSIPEPREGPPQPPIPLPGATAADHPEGGAAAAPAREMAPAGQQAQEAGQAERPPIPALARGRKRKKTWFEEIFDEDWLRTIPAIPPDYTRKEIDFLEASLQPSKESQVLDLGCGDGRHAIELASRGYQITGYDLSLPLLIHAADEAQRRQLKVNFVHGDFRELAFTQEFDAVYCLFTSFGYFDDDTNRKFIQSINHAMRVGGRLMLDVINRDYIIQDVPARIWWEGRGCVVLEEVDFNFFTSRIISKRSVVFEDGRHLEQEISVRSYSLHELGKILHHAGFRVLEVSGHLAHRTRFFGKDSRSLTLLAEKRTR